MLKLRSVLLNSKAAIDLASIMVGIIVIGLIGGVIAATVFAVIPWAQDNAAKQQLDSIHTAQNAAYGLSADPSRSLPEGQARNSFTNSAGLDTGYGLLSPNDSYCTVTSEDGQDYTAYAVSASGKIWSATNSSKQATALASGTTLTSDCQVTSTGGNNPTLPGEESEQEPGQSSTSANSYRYATPKTTYGTASTVTSHATNASWRVTENIFTNGQDIYLNRSNSILKYNEITQIWTRVGGSTSAKPVEVVDARDAMIYFGQAQSTRPTDNTTIIDRNINGGQTERNLNVRLTGLAIAEDGSLFGTAGNSIVVRSPKATIWDTLESGTIQGEVNDIKLGKDALFVATSTGIYKYDAVTGKTSKVSEYAYRSIVYTSDNQIFGLEKNIIYKQPADFSTNRKIATSFMFNPTSFTMTDDGRIWAAERAETVAYKQ